MLQLMYKDEYIFESVIREHRYKDKYRKIYYETDDLLKSNLNIYSMIELYINLFNISDWKNTGKIGYYLIGKI